MKYSGIRRPDVEPSEPKVNFRPLAAMGKASLKARPVSLWAMK
jgi:hypothetical protein